ncbi:MAG: thioredoxin-like domain-containing protein [Luteolibacter sp.]
MKALRLFCALFVCSACFASAAMETWTNRQGKGVQMELVSVDNTDGNPVGEFRTASGQTVKVKASDLSEADAKRLAEWKAPAASPFDSWFEKDLVKLEGKSLRRVNEFTKPTKYYLFYYTASWCGPCHKFTPSLVEFYNKNKSPEFEVVLITSDDSEKDMEGYAAELKMPWPQLRLNKVARFKKEFKHPGTGIPNLVLTDLQGNLLKTSYVDGKYMGPASVMNHLGSILSK